jgi:hypothetical protein
LLFGVVATLAAARKHAGSKGKCKVLCLRHMEEEREIEMVLGYFTRLPLPFYVMTIGFSLM